MREQIITLPFDVALPPVHALRAGNIDCIYERGHLRILKTSGIEVVRMLYGAVRDKDWNTAPYEIQDERLDASDKRFSISYTAFYTLDDIRYKAAYEIEGTKDSRIIYSMKGEALSSFYRNRIGLCVLHPIDECAGQNVVVTNRSGNQHHGSFPKTISPHQPFFDIDKLEYTINGMQVTLQFEGDVFEMEDQRNWADASYKTYSAPLRLPRPVLVQTGETMAQKVTLKVSGAATGSVIKQEATEEKIPFSKIGFARTPDAAALNETQYGLLKKLPFDHYRVELDLVQPNVVDIWNAALADAKNFSTALELVVYADLNNHAAKALLYRLLEKATPFLYSLLLLQRSNGITPQTLLQKEYEVLKKLKPHLQIGYGTDRHFAELNRARPEKTPHDFLCFPLYPQVHASDIRSVLENGETPQQHTLQTAQTFSSKPVHVSPLTFSKPHAVDTRLHTNVAAWWTLKSLQNLASARCLTFDLTHLFQENTNEPTPLYDAFVRINAFAPAWVIQKTYSAEDVVFENSSGERLCFRLGEFNAASGIGF